MTGCSVPLILAVLLLGGVGLVAAQIPTVCANNADLQSGRCCPNNCGGSDRGTCTQVSMMCKTNYNGVPLPPSDERFNWPSQIFTQVCQCKGNYGGYNCSECKFGYEGQNCSTKTVQVRKSITAADFDWTEYRTQLNRAKTAPYTRYKVYAGKGSVQDEMSYKPVTLYNLFAWMHHYVAWTVQENYTMDGSAGDYAHESVGFLTWHRIYLLWFEREMQILLGDNQFTVRYWDWTIPSNRLTLFFFNKLGVSNPSNGEVTGALMNNWRIVCADTNGDANKTSVCDPTITPGNRRVFRCGTVGNCGHSGWPDEANVRRGLNDFTNYRANTNPGIANKYDMMSFSNYIEGFAVDDDCESLGDERRLLCGENPEIRRRLHNLVHILLGGTIGSIPIAANDPVFINHHTMIDCLFEQWLQSSRSNKQYPRTLDPKFAGHAAGDCIVPFIPVYNHGEVFSKSANDYGYSCDLRSFLATDTHSTEPSTQQPTTAGADTSFASVITLVSMLVLCLAAVAV